MQTQTQQTAGTPAPVVITVGPGGQTQALSVPKTRAELRDLVRQREALSDQLTSVSDRRSELSTELQGTVNGVARTGLEQRISLLDQRILRLEADLATTGEQLSSAPAGLVESSDSYTASPSDDGFAKGVAAGGGPVVVIAVVLFLGLRHRWRRQRQRVQPQLPNEVSQRLERLEQGMDAIAVEIERVSEGQRFVTKLLSTRDNAPAIKAEFSREP
jgi:uncharacterized small protein (DUF1192 family)